MLLTGHEGMNDQPLILVLCTGNSRRSHLAEGILREALGDPFRVASAGSRPAGFVHPLALRAMAEIGLIFPGTPQSMRMSP